MVTRWRIFHICLLTLLLAVLTISHYHDFLDYIPIIGDISISSSLGISGLTSERFIYILIVIYAGWSLGIKAGIATWCVSAIAMLTRVPFMSNSPIDTITESMSALAISGLSLALIQLSRGWRSQQKKLLGVRVALRTTQENYEELFTNASDAIWVHDLTGKIIMANKACEKLTGYSAEEGMGRSVSKFMSTDALSLASDIRAKLMEGQAIDQRYDQKLIKKDGSEAMLELFTRIIRDDNGKPIAFQNIARDVTEERRLRDNLRFQIHKTLMAQEEERKRIARELHDDAAQSILLLSRQLDIILSEGAGKIPKTAVSELEHIQNIANDTYKNLQRYARDLRPSILDQMGLTAALNWLAEELSKELGIKTTVKADKLPPLPSQIELAMFRIAQEALSNIRKHAHASEVNIRLKLDSNTIKMTITDNGKGFLTSGLTGDLAREGKLGVLGMGERARLIGGDLQIKSRPGKGTSVIAETPI